MEVKKSPKADLQNKKSIFSLIGLAISILLMILLFSWSKKELKFELEQTEEVFIENEVVEITRQEPPKQAPPKVEIHQLTDMLEIVKDDIELDDTADLFSVDYIGDDVEIEIVDVEEEEEVVEEDIPVLQADKMPSFQGGDKNTYRQWVQGEVTYPVIAAENNIFGRVTMQFVVERDGSVSNIKALDSPDKSLTEECIKVIKKSPKWTPGENRGKPVRVTIIIPIMFQLN